MSIIFSVPHRDVSPESTNSPTNYTTEYVNHLDLAVSPRDHESCVVLRAQLSGQAKSN